MKIYATYEHIQQGKMCVHPRTESLISTGISRETPALSSRVFDLVTIVHCHPIGGVLWDIWKFFTPLDCGIHLVEDDGDGAQELIICRGKKGRSEAETAIGPVSHDMPEGPTRTPASNQHHHRRTMYILPTAKKRSLASIVTQSETG